MLFDTVEFHAMQSSLDSLWMRQKAISHNIANYETPNYKSKDVVFENVLKGAQLNTTGGGKYQFQTSMVTDENTKVRPDGNNVDLDVESLKLYQTYAQSSYLTQKINGQFTNMRYVLTNFMK